MNANLIILPVLIPMLSAILGLVRPASHRYQKTVGMVGMVLLFLASVWLTVSVVREEIMVLRVGGWSAPWGIVLVADRLSAAMTSATPARPITWPRRTTDESLPRTAERQL